MPEYITVMKLEDASNRLRSASAVKESLVLQMVQVLRKMPSDGGAATAKCQMLAAILQTWLVQAQHELTNMVEESTSPSTVTVTLTERDSFLVEIVELILGCELRRQFTIRTDAMAMTNDQVGRAWKSSETS